MSRIRWIDRAKCAGADVGLFDLEDMRGHRHEDRGRDWVAWSLCHGCEVIPECARDAVENGDKGLVRAGVWLPITDSQAGRVRAQRNRLRVVAGV